MRSRLATILLLLALSSFVIAQAGSGGLTALDSGAGSGVKGALGGMSCLADPKNIASVVIVLAVAVGVIRKKNSEGAGSNIATVLTPIMGIMILIQAAMSGALCKGGQTMYLVMAFALLQTIGEGQTSSKNPFLGLFNMLITVAGFQYLLSTPSLMNNPANLTGFLMGQVILTQVLNSAGGGISFSGFGGSILSGLKGLKIRRGPRGENTDKEVEKEVQSKLKEVQKYIAQMEKQAHDRINNERKQAKKAAKEEIRYKGIKKRTKYAKIEERLFNDANELTLLSKDLMTDQLAISENSKKIADFENTLRAQIRDAYSLVVSFINRHNEEEAAQLTKKGSAEGRLLDDEMTTLTNISKGLESSFKTTLNGIIFFAKLTVLIETAHQLFNVANNYLGDTQKNMQLKEKVGRKKANEQKRKLEKDSKNLKKVK